MITAIALDDEHLALDIISVYCEAIDNVHLKATFTNQQKAIEYLYAQNIDVLFLDIEMPGLNGIELYKSLQNKTKVIFTTAYSEYAIEGFNVNAVDYLLKPIVQKRFNEAVAKAVHMIELEKLQTTTHIQVKAAYKTYQIDIADILFLEGLDDYIKIHLTDQSTIVTRATLKSMLQKLPETKFIRIHKSYIIALDKVSSYYKQTLKISSFTLPVSATYKDKVAKKFQ